MSCINVLILFNYFFFNNNSRTASRYECLNCIKSLTHHIHDESDEAFYIPKSKNIIEIICELKMVNCMNGKKRLQSRKRRRNTVPIALCPI